MKTIHAMVLPLLAGGLVMVSGCIVEGPPPPGPVVVAPAPPVEVEVVPDYYCWDGYEYVGYVGDDCYYLGPGSVWIICDPVRVERFHAWVGVHPDWRAHLTVNVNYRNDAHGTFHPQRSVQAREQDRNRDRGDRGRARGHDRDHN